MMKKILLYTVAIWFLCLTTMSIYAATPSVSSVSGSIATGQMLTVTGSNLVAEDKTNWDTNFIGDTGGFEGTNIVADGYTFPSSGELPWPPIYDLSVKLMGNQSVKFHIEGANSGENVSCLAADWCSSAEHRSYGCADAGTSKSCNTSSCTAYGVPEACCLAYHVSLTCPPASGVTTWRPNSYMYKKSILLDENNTGDLWYRWYTKFDWKGGTLWPYYMKHFYSQGDIIYLDTSNSYQSIGSNGMPYKFAPKIGANGYLTDTLPDGLLRNNVWYCTEVHLNDSATGPNYEIYVNGILVFTNSQSGGGANGQSTPWIGITNYSQSTNTDTTLDIDEWWDGYAISSSRIYPAAMIEIGNSPTYGQGSEKHQDPVYLSDTSIQFTADLTGLGNGPYYLWITNNQQNTNTSYLLGGIYYTVSPSAGAHGSISPATPQSVLSGATTTFTVTPDTGYSASASGCGGSLVGSSYTIASASADCTVSATFTAISFGWSAGWQSGR
jgi:hypothetical protein